MRATTTITALLIFLFLGLTGCGRGPLWTALGLPKLAISDENVTSQGAEPLLDIENFEKIDLIAELCGIKDDKDGPQRPKICEEKNGKENGEKTVEEKAEENAKNLAKAFAFFNKKSAEAKKPEEDNTIRRRNGIQERILAASMQRCGEFKNFLRQFQTEMGFGLGAAATTLGGLGAIFTPLSTVRALSGAAGIMSGIRAEFNESFFYNQMVHVITQGIDARRAELYKKIKCRQDDPLTTYPIQAAVKDAVEFHQSCSTIVGFQVAGNAIQQTKDPGLKRLKESLGHSRCTK